MSPASLQRAWRTKPWMQRLSGLTCEPLMQSRGVAAWILSLRAIRASLSPSQAGSKPKLIQDTCGLTSQTLFAPSHRACASLKTSPTIYAWALNKSTMTYTQWVIALRRACLQRKKLVLHTRGRDSLSWPTITATDAFVNKARPPQKMIRKDGRNVLRTPSLAETVMQPKDFPYTKQDLEKHQEGKAYTTAKVYWPTPRAQEPGSNSAGHGKGLAETAKAWPTPLARDWKDTAGMDEAKRRQTSLASVAFHSGPHPPTTTTDGHTSQKRLNPQFAEWLMGWPIGWTDCAPAATAWCLWLQRMLCVLSFL